MGRAPARRGLSRGPSAAAPGIRELVGIRRTLTTLNPAAAPQAVQICGSPLASTRRLVAVAGSFDPPHTAHVALLRSGLGIAHADGGAFVLSVRTVDKERVSGMLLEDRLWLLCRLEGARVRDQGSGTRGQGPGVRDQHAAAEGSGGELSKLETRLGVLATNRGLYVDQAQAVRRLCPRLDALVFVVGYDKIVQIFDPRYYQNRDAALRALFAAASFLVAPRDEHTVADVEALLAEPANRPFRHGVAALPIDPALAHVSSTEARASAGEGRLTEGVVPDLVARFIAATGCYTHPEGSGPYAVRAAALAQAAGP